MSQVDTAIDIFDEVRRLVEEVQDLLARIRTSKLASVDLPASLILELRTEVRNIVVKIRGKLDQFPNV